MKHILEYLFSKKSDLDKLHIGNRFDITKKDMIGDLKGFPVGVVVRILEETEKQGNKPSVMTFQNNLGANRMYGGFDWDNTKDCHDFWADVILYHKFDKFYKAHPEYKKYDI